MQRDAFTATREMAELAYFLYASYTTVIRQQKLIY